MVEVRHFQLRQTLFRGFLVVALNVLLQDQLELGREHLYRLVAAAGNAFAVEQVTVGREGKRVRIDFPLRNPLIIIIVLIIRESDLVRMGKFWGNGPRMIVAIFVIIIGL